MRSLGTTPPPPPSLALAGSRAVVAETVSVRLLGRDVPLLTFPHCSEVIAVAGFDLVTRVPGTTVFAVGNTGPSYSLEPRCGFKNASFPMADRNPAAQARPTGPAVLYNMARDHVHHLPLACGQAQPLHHAGMIYAASVRRIRHAQRTDVYLSRQDT
ncbi:hypothetical protein F5Y12DRAFT_720513 [Xylaria sp. FL1777]|nr:hypothetical protein F5Y12DRAFT_720513 [Xylaria sp. FL1777]